jgi:hypothetical protein
LWHAKTAAGQQRIGSDAKRANKKVKTNKEQPNTTRRIRLELSKEQKKELLKQWMGTNRWTYNRAVASQLTTKKELRQKFVNNDVFADEPTKRWVLDPPYDVRECAITDLTKAIKSTKALLKTGHIEKFKMKFRSKKDRQQSINVRNRLYKSEGEKAFSFLRGSFECAKVDPVIKAREPRRALGAHSTRRVVLVHTDGSGRRRDAACAGGRKPSPLHHHDATKPSSHSQQQQQQQDRGEASVLSRPRCADVPVPDCVRRLDGRSDRSGRG